MKLSYFVGACDKSDMLLGICTLLSRLNRRVLLVDAMSSPWLKYRNQTWLTKEKWSHWNGIDTVSAVMNWDELEELASGYNIQLSEYDDIFIDTDRVAFSEANLFIEAHARYIVQTVESHSLHRNLEWLTTFSLLHDTKLDGKLQFIILHAVDKEQDQLYVEGLLHTSGYHSVSESVVIPYDESDWTAKMHNETEDMINVSIYARATKLAWRKIVESNFGPLADKVWRHCMKQPQKGTWLHNAM
ncbi:hypothetical protein MH117_07005 [Paenibacillus sp. ACRRX]|uniref:hypothetical protein n=1 Tax=Paenibacillus sp. ACRRX TaxID=2918206 RepID=UPI001EF4B052|nr:hypothetical protein [Paenibacillus sp. ACRRX]MCG7407161.1 hypothetical protein [Paenibacillus sp. ACRRX]